MCIFIITLGRNVVGELKIRKIDFYLQLLKKKVECVCGGGEGEEEEGPCVCDVSDVINKIKIDDK